MFRSKVKILLSTQHIMTPSLQKIYSIRDATMQLRVVGTFVNRITCIRHTNLQYLVKARYIIDSEEKSITIYNVKNPWEFQHVCDMANIKTTILYRNYIYVNKKHIALRWGDVTSFDMC